MQIKTIKTLIKTLNKKGGCLKCKSTGECLKCPTGQKLDMETRVCVECSVAAMDNSLNCLIKAYSYCSLLTVDGQYCNKCESPDLVYDV